MAETSDNGGDDRRWLQLKVDDDFDGAVFKLAVEGRRTSSMLEEDG